MKEQGHDTFSVYDQARGASDDWIMRKAFDEDWILITNDKDFGEKAFREGCSHKSVVLLRLQDERAQNKIEILTRLLRHFSLQLEGKFAVVTEKQIRFARPQR